MKPKKSLGQNFLINPKVAQKIAKEADISKSDIVLEIGPGTGNLTKHLLDKAKKVIAVEKDNKLFESLQEKFAAQIKSGSLVLVHDDILNFDMGESENIFLGLKSYKIVANIPYNITGAILKKFLIEENQPKSMTLMVQREVGDRIVARDKKESLLSISVKAYGEPKILFRVSRGNFYPAPNVDSAVIAIKNISRKLFRENGINPVRGREGSQRPSASNGINEEKFWEIVKAGFAHKRKKLSGNLKNVIFGQKTALASLGDKRAEDLSLLEWITLSSS